jgi:hypothetical protein
VFSCSAGCGLASGDGCFQCCADRPDRDIVKVEARASTPIAGFQRPQAELLGCNLQPTFLFAEVEVVATYELFNINRSKLENLIHRIFGPARFDVEILDRFGRPVVPREWFMVPLFMIDDPASFKVVSPSQRLKIIRRAGLAQVPKYDASCAVSTCAQPFS